MKKVIFTILILGLLIASNVKPFKDPHAGYCGAVVFLNHNVYERLAKIAQMTNQDEQGALKDYKIPFVKNGYIVFEIN